VKKYRCNLGGKEMFQGENCSRFDPKNEYLNKCTSNFFDVKKQAYTFLYIFLLLLVSISILLYISQVLNINNANYQILQLEQELQTIREEQESLEIELASKTSLAKIETAAKNRLNMVEAKNKEVLVYNENFDADENFVADIPKEKFFLAEIYDKIVARIMTVQAETID